MHGIEQQIVEFLTRLLQSIGWPGVVVIMALESANIPIPSEVTMPLAGWMLVQARGLSALAAVWQGGLFGALGCTIGSALSYALGAWGGRPLLQRYGRWIMVSEEDLANADKWFARWGDWAAFISRLLPIVRTFISFPAGIAKIKFGRFLVFTFIGSFIWCGLLALGGFYSAATGKRSAQHHAAVRYSHRHRDPGRGGLLRLPPHPAREAANGKRQIANQRISESANQRISESANQRIGESANQRIGESANQRIGESANQRIGESANQRILPLACR